MADGPATTNWRSVQTRGGARVLVPSHSGREHIAHGLPRQPTSLPTGWRTGAIIATRVRSIAFVKQVLPTMLPLGERS
jgi:hypothetical protein